MTQSEESIPFFRFFKENGTLFTCSALFAAFYYYVVNLLKDPTAKMDTLNQTILNTTYSQQTPQVRQLIEQIASLQIAAVISFLIFAIILVSIIIIAVRYDLVTIFFAVLLSLFLFYSFIYLISSLREPLYAVLSIFFPIVFFLTYLNFMDEGRRKYLIKPEYFGLFWFVVFDCLLITCIELTKILYLILTLTPTIELLYIAIFLVFWLMMTLASLSVHFHFLLIYYIREKKPTLSEFNDNMFS
jgi:hypothetical protein